MGSERAPKAAFRGAGVAPVQKEPGTEKRSHVEIAATAPPARPLVHPLHPVTLTQLHTLPCGG